MAIKAKRSKRRLHLMNIATDHCVDCKRDKKGLRTNSILCSTCYNRRLQKKLDA